MTKELVCLDIETTGLNQQTNHIIQLSLVKFSSENFDIIDTRDWYIIPEDEWDIDPTAAYITNLTKEFILEKGVKLRTIFPEIKNFLGDCDILTYNGNNFDIGFLYNDLKQLGLELDYDRNFYDAYTIECMIHSNNLTSTYKRYTGKDIENAHNSLSDVLATIEVFKHQVNITNIEDVNHTILSPEGWLFVSNDILMFNRGKYYRKPVAEVCKTDPSYIRWIFSDCSAKTKKSIMDEYFKVYPK